MVKKCLFKQEIHPQIQKLQEFFVISNQNAQFITSFSVLVTWAGPTMSSVFFIGDPSLVGEPRSGVRNLVFITNYHSNKYKVWLLLANLKVSLNKFSYQFPVWPYWLINFFKETCFTFDYTLKYAVRKLTLGHSQEAFPIFGSRKMCHHSGYLYINNQCSSLVDIHVMYANYRCHEPGRIEVSIGSSVSEISWLVH